MAAATRGVSAFVALALDDDIAGADGANVALSGTYRIDYLDTEHLYHVADQHVLCKKPQARSAIHEIYSSLRATVSGFNWSESRFALLYPVHPLIADVASAVRLYVPHFSFLPFAASVARHAAARPALSLVLLDELFEGVEADLRKSAELRGAFAAYDHLLAESVERLPVMQRYQARLLLKSLFILSLDGRGATARELCAALLLPDDDAQAAGSGRRDARTFHGRGAARQPASQRARRRCRRGQLPLPTRRDGSSSLGPRRRRRRARSRGRTRRPRARSRRRRASESSEHRLGVRRRSPQRPRKRRAVRPAGREREHESERERGGGGDHLRGEGRGSGKRRSHERRGDGCKHNGRARDRRRSGERGHSSGRHYGGERGCDGGRRGRCGPVRAGNAEGRTRRRELTRD